MDSTLLVLFNTWCVCTNPGYDAILGGARVSRLSYETIPPQNERENAAAWDPAWNCPRLAAGATSCSGGPADQGIAGVLPARPVRSSSGASHGAQVRQSDRPVLPVAARGGGIGGLRAAGISPEAGTGSVREEASQAGKIRPGGAEDDGGRPQRRR